MPLPYNIYAQQYRELKPDAEDDEIKRGYKTEGYGSVEAFGQGVQQGFHQTLGGFGTLGDMMGLPTKDWAEEQYKKSEQYALPEYLSGNVYDTPSLAADPRWLAHTTGQVIPSLISTLLPGAAAYKGAKFLGGSPRAARMSAAGFSGLMGGSLEGAGTYRETGNMGEALAMGGTSAMLNMLPAYKLFGPMGKYGLPGKMLATGGAEALTEWAEEPAEALITGQDPIEAAKRGLNVVPGSFISAMLLGGGGAAMQSQAKKKAAKTSSYYYDKENDVVIPPNVMAATEEARARPQTYKINTPEREQLRAEVTAQMYGEGAANKDKVVDIVMGPPAAGKSSAIAEPLAKANGSILIDSDTAKELLPEYDNGMGAGAVHQESSDIADQVLSQAIDNNDNIVMPVVGKTLEGLQERIGLFKQLGYTVNLHYVDLPLKKSVDRAVARYRKTGRLVDPKYILEDVARRPAENYETLREEGLADDYKAYSNDVAFGQPAQEIAELTGPYPGLGRGDGQGPAVGSTEQGIEENLRARMEQGQTIPAEKLKGFQPIASDYIQNAPPFEEQTPQQREQMHQAKLSLPTHGDEAAASRERIKKRVEARRVSEPEGGYQSTVPSRPDATPEIQKDQRDLLNEMEDKAVEGPLRGNMLANAINTEMRHKGGYNITGKTINSPEDLATLAQNWRDPRYETLRYIFVKGNRVMGQVGISQRLPSSAAAFPVEFEDGVAWLNEQMEAHGADGFWMQHNHPSGNPNPSHADENLTAHLQGATAGRLRGHVIIDSNQYAHISVNRQGGASTAVLDKDFGPDTILDPMKPGFGLGMPVNNPAGVANIGQTYLKGEAKDGWAVLIGTAGGGANTRAVMEIPARMLGGQNYGRLKAQIRKFARQTGSGSVFMHLPEGHAETLDQFPQYKNLMRDGFLRDVVATEKSGKTLSVAEDSRTTIVPWKSFGIEPGAVAREVNQPDSPYGKVTAMPPAPAAQAAAPTGAPPGPPQGDPEVRKIAKEKGGEAATDASRRGTQSWEATTHLANVLGTTPAEVDKFLRRKFGTAFNAEQLHQSAAMVEQEWAEKSQLFQGLNEKMNEGELNDNDMAEAYEAILSLNSMNAQFMGVRAEAGRALNIFRKLQDTVGLVEAISQETNKKGGRDMLKAQIALLADMKKPGAGMKTARDVMKITKWDKFLEYYTAALVSGLPTHVVNSVSNTAMQFLEDSSRVVASALGGLFGSSDRITMGELGARMSGYTSGTRMGLQAFWEMVKDEDAQMESMPVTRGLIKTEGRHEHAIGGLLGKGIRIPFRFLGAEDMFFKSLTVGKELAGLAYVESQKTGQPINEILNNPTQEMLNTANAEAARITFTEQAGPISQLMTKIGADFPVFRIIAPFIRTPGNLIKQGLKHSVAAPLFESVRNDIKKGGRVRDIAVARMITGSAISSTAVGLAMAGLLTGSPPEDPNERRMWYQQGNQPNSIKMGDTWVSYSRLEPFGMLLGIAADMHTFSTKIGTDEAGELAALLTSSVMSNLTSKTYLRGVSELIAAINEPERYGERWLQRLGATVTTPTFLAYTAKATDDRLRKAETLMDMIKSRVPGMRTDLPERLDVFGQPIMEEGSGAYRFFSPAYLKKVKYDPVAREILANEVRFPVVGKKFRGVEMSPDDHNSLVKAVGKPTYNVLKRVVMSPGYKNLPPPLKKWMLQKVIDSVRSNARLYWSMKHPKILQEAQKLRREKTFGTT